MFTRNFVVQDANAFTLAEVLITLGVIGVVAAVTMPTLVSNIQERVRKEQVRTVKYKLTKATDKMKSLGKIGRYDAPATMNFINELKKHMTIAKICDSSHLAECWPTDTINTYLNNSTDLSTVSVSDLTKGTGLNALAVSSGGEDTVGIVTGDGVPMLLVYSPVCQALDEVKTYTWSVEDGKPITNATTNCISAIFDINGSKGPNKIGTDVRTLNSAFGAVSRPSATANKSECKTLKKKYNIKWCENDEDYWVGAIKQCEKLGLSIPNLSTMANIANSKFGTNKIGTYSIFFSATHEACNYAGGVKKYVLDRWFNQDNWWIDMSDDIFCGEMSSYDSNSAYNPYNKHYWVNTEFSTTSAFRRDIFDNYSTWLLGNRRNDPNVGVLCVSD